MNVSYFTVQPHRYDEWIACLWEGPAPDDLTIHTYLHLPGEPRRMLVLWDGDEAAMERLFGDFGTFVTEEAFDATEGLRACVARDLERFATLLRTRGASEADVERQIDLRRRGLEAPSRDAALAAAAAWSRGERASGGQ